VWCAVSSRSRGGGSSRRRGRGTKAGVGGRRMLLWQRRGNGGSAGGCGSRYRRPSTDSDGPFLEHICWQLVGGVRGGKKE